MQPHVLMCSTWYKKDNPDLKKKNLNPICYSYTGLRRTGMNLKKLSWGKFKYVSYAVNIKDIQERLLHKYDEFEDKKIYAICGKIYIAKDMWLRKEKYKANVDPVYKTRNKKSSDSK